MLRFEKPSTNHRAADAKPASSNTAPSAIASLLVGTSAEIGDMVFLNDVHLQAGPKPELFVVSGAKGARMLVSFKARIGSEVVPGDVDIKGTIHGLPPLEVLRKDWKLTKDELHFFRDQKVYIVADYVKGAKS